MRFFAEKQVAIMGTTASAVYFAQDEAVACNIGDSKIFRIRNSQMMQISEDHTDEKIMNAVGVKKKPVLLQYLGIPDTEMELEPFISKGDIEAGDVFIICSDGVTEAVTVNEMYEIIKQNNANDSVKRILAEVDKKDGFDNATVIIAKIGK